MIDDVFGGIVGDKRFVYDMFSDAVNKKRAWDHMASGENTCIRRIYARPVPFVPNVPPLPQKR